MKDNPAPGLLEKNKLGPIPEGDRTEQHYLEAVKAFARLTYESVYVIDYSDMSFEYVSENPLFLSGLSAGEVLRLGYAFYFQHVPEKDLALLSAINDAGFDFYSRLPAEERTAYSITYDFHLNHKDGRQILINHKLTPLFLTKDGRMWKAMCIVSLSHHQAAGNARILKQSSGEIWELSLASRKWKQMEKTVLTEKETEVLRLHAQGLSIPQIAEKLFVAPDTVKYYRRRIFERLEVTNIVEALAAAVSGKLL